MRMFWTFPEKRTFALFLKAVFLFFLKAQHECSVCSQIAGGTYEGQNPLRIKVMIKLSFILEKREAMKNHFLEI